MNDDILNSFIEKLVTENIDEDIFREHINVFSRFLGYSNSDYKYNATYLSQYIDDFLKTSCICQPKIRSRDLILDWHKHLLCNEIFFNLPYQNK